MSDVDLDYTDNQVFKPGDRVELSPACDLWMRGARYGTVVPLREGDVSTDGSVWVRVQLDRVRRHKLFAVKYLRHSGGF